MTTGVEAGDATRAEFVLIVAEHLLTALAEVRASGVDREVLIESVRLTLAQLHHDAGTGR